MPQDLLYSEAPARPAVQAITANTVTSPTDRLFVTIPSFDSRSKWGPVVWTPRGKQYPPAGTRCMVTRDDRGLWWVTQWVGDWTDQVAPGVWQSIPFNATNWANFGGGFETFQWLLDAAGFVHVRGMVKSVAGYAFASAGTLLIGTLPVGARPGAGGAVTGAFMYQQDTTPAQSIVRLNILPADGTIRIADAITGPANNGNVQFGSLSVIPFQAA